MPWSGAPEAHADDLLRVAARRAARRGREGEEAVGVGFGGGAAAVAGEEELVLAEHKVVLGAALLWEGEGVLGAAQVEVLDALAVPHRPVGVHVHGHPHQRRVAARRAEELRVVVADLEARVALEHVLLDRLDHQALHVHHAQPDLQQHVLHRKVCRRARHPPIVFLFPFLASCRN